MHLDAPLQATRARFRAAAVLLGLGVLIAAFPTSALSSSIGVSAPQYDSPGGTVPTIVTVYGLPAGFGATISARGTKGATAACLGRVWINRNRRTASRKCYLRLPLQPGSYNIVGRARLKKGDVLLRAVTGAGRRPVLANGYRSPNPMSLGEMVDIERCFNTTDRVWLTFDDGGSTVQVNRILSTLRAHNVRARFFFTGAWAQSNPTMARRIRTEGHAVGNHSFTHPPLSRSSREEVLGQIDRGMRPSSSSRLLRPPFAAGAFTSRLQRLAASRGYRLCRWTADTYDWQGPTAARMVERITHGDEMTPPVAAGGNILMHGAGPNTSTGLGRIIRAVRGKGLRLEPLRRRAR